MRDFTYSWIYRHEKENEKREITTNTNIFGWARAYPNSFVTHAHKIVEKTFFSVDFGSFCIVVSAFFFLPFVRFSSAMRNETCS